MTAVPLIFVFIGWFSRRVNEVFRCRGGSVSRSRIVLWRRCFSCSSLCACCRCVFLWSAIFLAFASFGRCLFHCSFACIPILFPAARIWRREWEACLQSIGKVDAERQMVADAPVVERTEVGAEGLGERAAAEWFEQRRESEEMNGLQGGVELHCGREERG